MNIKLNGTLVLIGAGKMGGAMLEGWLKAGIDPKKVVALDPAVDGDDCFGSADLRGDAFGDVGEGVLVLGEHDELARTIPRTKLLGAQQVAQLGPLGVETAVAHRLGEVNQFGQLKDLDLDIDDAYVDETRPEEGMEEENLYMHRKFKSDPGQKIMRLDQ